MITECRHKITTFNRTNRNPITKCKRQGKYTIQCEGEGKCGHVINQNKIMKKQESKR